MWAVHPGDSAKEVQWRRMVFPIKGVRQLGSHTQPVTYTVRKSRSGVVFSLAELLPRNQGAIVCTERSRAENSFCNPEKVFCLGDELRVVIFTPLSQ